PSTVHFSPLNFNLPPLSLHSTHVVSNFSTSTSVSVSKLIHLLFQIFIWYDPNSSLASSVVTYCSMDLKIAGIKKVMRFYRVGGTNLAQTCVYYNKIIRTIQKILHEDPSRINRCKTNLRKIIALLNEYERAIQRHSYQRRPC